MKKIALILVAVLCLCAANKTMAQVVASGTTGGCAWEITGTSPNYTLTISGNGAMENYFYSTYTPWYSYHDYIKILDIQQGVTIIGSSTFSDFSGLTSITIGNSVTTIETFAFSNCTGLTSVSIPNTVTTIEYFAFSNCSGLTGALTIPNSVTVIRYSAFASCSGLTSVTISNSMTTIESNTFEYCSGLTSITIPNSVTSIGSGAFRGCSGLTSVTIPNSVTSIDVWAFEGCSGLTSVTIPNSVTSIDVWAFEGCSGLTSISVDANNTSYSSNSGVLFDKAQTTLISCPAGKTGNYTIPNSVTSIGNSAFYYCSGLTSVTIPNSVTSIGYWAFRNCSGLTSVTIPNSVTSIGDGAFYYCSGLTSVTIGNSVTSIGDATFYYCSGLTSVTIPNSVDSIGDFVFYGCSGLTEMYVKALTPPSINGNSTFSSVSTTIPVHVPCGSVAAYQSASGWSSFTNIIGDVSFANITVQSNDNTMGSATITQMNTCTNDTAIIAATANTGYRFVQWNDGNTTNPRTIIVTSDTSFTAEFVTIQRTYQLSVTTNDPDMGTVSGSGYYLANATATITATPNTGYRFVQWNDGNTTNPRTITVISDTVFTAYFASATVTNANIKDLIPNINRSDYKVKRLSTIYRYYQITDADGMPVPGAIIDYTVNNKLYSSSPSDINGALTLAFKTWGTDVDDNDDDNVNLGINQMFFSGLRMEDGKSIPVLENDFLLAFISVSQYQAEEQIIGIELGAGLETKQETAFEDYKLSVSDKAKLALKSEFEDDWSAESQLKSFKYVFENEVKLSAGYGFHTPTPVVKFGVMDEAGTVQKLKHEEEFSSFLKIGTNLLTDILDRVGSTDTKLYSIVTALGHYLEATTDYKTESNTGLTNKNSFAGELDISFGTGSSGVKAELSTSKKMSFIFGSTEEYDGSKQTTTFTNYVTTKQEGDIEMSVGYKDATGAKYGASATVAQASGMKIARKIDENNHLAGGDITLNQEASIDVSMEFGNLIPWSPSLDILASKEYEHKYSFGKAIFDNANKFTINEPVWNYLNNRSSAYIPLAEDINSALFNIGAGMCTTDTSLLKVVNSGFTRTSEKKYSAGIGLSKKLELKSAIFGLDWSFTMEGNLFVEGKYPLGEGQFQGNANKILSVVKYEDIDKGVYWFSPAQRLDELWDNIVSSIMDFGGAIAEKAKEYWHKLTAMFSSEDNKGKTLTSVQRSRKYAKSLSRYSQLREKGQTDISTFSFILPGENQAFELNTTVDMEYFYPGGSLLGATVEQDTFVVISDVFYLRGYHNNDTLSVAPLGNFKVYTTLGADDLSFLEINSTYPVSVYYQAMTSDHWERIGTVNDTISTNRFGIYCLGISVNGDKEAPKININKSDSSRRVNITVTDNMAVAWKRVLVLINGLVTECNRSGNTLSVDLQDNQLDEEVYVTVYAFDLANNESQLSAEFGKTELPEDPGTGDDIKTHEPEIQYCKLYPNPATNSCRLFVSKDLLNDAPLKYAIISPQGQVYQRGKILNEETIINLEQLSSGIYFIAVYNENKIISNRKLIINK
ncbi:MAG: leucine-rich repeat domain-containing protein [Bacteroidales bacterium]|jgi:hypothetical protein|nr:leucine-rich repeat domain-containing protein [Bacteroidales bacterium]